MCFQSGFDSKSFEDMEGGYKAKAALLVASLGNGWLNTLVSRGEFQEVSDLSMKILQATNLASGKKRFA